MHVVDAMGTGALVEVVYVLGARGSSFRGQIFCELLLDFCEREVGGVGLSRGSMAAAALGVEVPDESGVGCPGFGRGDVFDAVAIPEASGAAEGGETTFCGRCRRRSGRRDDHWG